MTILIILIILITLIILIVFWKELQNIVFTRSDLEDKKKSLTKKLF